MTMYFIYGTDTGYILIKKLLETVVKKGKKILPKINSLKKINKFS